MERQICKYTHCKGHFPNIFYSEETEDSKYMFLELVVSLMNGAVGTRLDIAHAANAFSQ